VLASEGFRCTGSSARLEPGAGSAAGRAPRIWQPSRRQVVIQLTDDEKFLWKGGALEDYARFADANARDILAVGFDRSKTFVFKDTEAIGDLYPNVLRIQRAVTYSQARATFGFVESDCIGFAPAVQPATALPVSHHPCTMGEGGGQHGEQCCDRKQHSARRKSRN